MCNEAGDNVVPNVLSPRDLVSRHDSMDETVLHTLNSFQPFDSHSNIRILFDYPYEYSNINSGIGCHH